MNERQVKESAAGLPASSVDRTLSGLPIRPLYGPTGEHIKEMPGAYPFTRGVYETMYRGKLWTMRMFAGFGSPQQTNERFRLLLSRGQTGLSTAFDMPSLMGRDPDDPLSLGEVGREGVSVASVEDMSTLFSGIALDQVSTSMTINASASAALAFYVVAAERTGVSSQKLSGTIQNDMLKEFIAQKEWVTGVRPSMRIFRDMLVWCTQNMPKWHPVSISGYHIREAGATAVQELAFTLADGVGYVQCGVDAGLSVDSFAPRLSFFFDIHNDFFEEIAKLRAARRIWAKIMRERFGAKDARSWTLRTHCQTAGVSLTAQQPLNNVARVALQALAAVLGGTQSLHTNSLDETYALPTEEAATVALRTQQLIAYESGVAKVIDPLGGSYFIEQLTDDIEKAATHIMSQIDAMGGIVEAVENGFPQREIAQSAYDFQRRVERGEESIIGVNRFVTDEQPSVPTLKIDPRVEEDQIQRVRALRQKRNAKQATAALQKLEDACRTDANLMEIIVHAARADCTLGEICNVFRNAFGEYRDPGGF